MARSRIAHVLRKIPTGSIMVGDKEVATSIRTQNEFWKRLDVVIEDQKTLLHETLKQNIHMIDPETGEIMMR
jgi:ABC-type transport system involved in cytochrome bd biosynthesis fused ATPase/permease subunit